MTEWAHLGAAGDPPSPDMERRRALASARERAEVIALAAAGAKAGIEGDLAAVQRELAELGGRIELAALDVVALELPGLHGKVDEATVVFAGRFAEYLAPRYAIGAS